MLSLHNQSYDTVAFFLLCVWKVFCIYNYKKMQKLKLVLRF